MNVGEARFVGRVGQLPKDWIMSVATRVFVGAALVLVAVPAALRADDFEREPISYSQSTPSNSVSRLFEKIASGEKRLTYESETGFLRSLLAELNVPVSSQMLVFSKTSMQRHRISPETPRALYFNDDVYIGYCREGDVLEIDAVDPQLGAVFYTIDQEPSAPPLLRRQTDNCLICHGSSQTKDVPGHVVRSVFTDQSGLPVLSAGTYRIDHTSPLEKRWGGWYVTGTHGAQKHLGNLIVKGKTNPDRVDNSAGLNVVSLDGRVDTSAYLSPHSDLVALMVFEHQADAHNYITRASFLTRQAMHYQDSLNRDGRAGRPRLGQHQEPHQERRRAAGRVSAVQRRGPALRQDRRNLGLRRRVQPARPARLEGQIAARLRSDQAAVQVSVQLSRLFR
jgi:hypothetical protein